MDRCIMCRKVRKCILMFAPVEPRSGLGYDDIVRNPGTGKENHPWSKDGKWVRVCPDCFKQAIGLRCHRPHKRRD